MMNYRSYSLLALAIWLFFSPWLIPSDSFAMNTSDMLSALVITLSVFAKFTWGAVSVGLWLLLAPLLFWAPEVATYVNNTLVGVGVLVFAFVLERDNESHSTFLVPYGMTQNPSSWARRIPVAFLALAACLTARYMASFQLGYINQIYDPLFDQGLGTYYVITSDISKSFPISDAGLGAVAYILEALLALKGSTRRWHTMPWVVSFFGVLVVPVGIVSSILILLQPFAVGHWCFWCLLTAFFMLCMVILTIDEVKATLQFLRRAKREGYPIKDAFWYGSKIME